MRDVENIRSTYKQIKQHRRMCPEEKCFVVVELKESEGFRNSEKSYSVEGYVYNDFMLGRKLQFGVMNAACVPLFNGHLPGYNRNDDMSSDIKTIVLWKYYPELHPLFVTMDIAKEDGEYNWDSPILSVIKEFTSDMCLDLVIPGKYKKTKTHLVNHTRRSGLNP